MAQSLNMDMAKLKGFKKDNGNSGVKGYIYLKISDLIPDTKHNGAFNNSNNVVAEVTSLAESIAVNGLLVPFIVRVENGKNYIVSGHRRYHAIQTLIESGRLTGDETYVAKVIDNKFQSEGELLMSMISDNITQRNKTDGILFYSYRIVRNYWDNDLKKDKAKLKELSAQNKGYKNAREFSVMMLSVSSGTVAKLEKIDKHGTADLKNALESDKITLELANLIVDLPPEIKAEALNIALENDKDTARGLITDMRDKLIADREQKALDKEIEEYEDGKTEKKAEKKADGENEGKDYEPTAKPEKTEDNDKPNFDTDENSKPQKSTKEIAEDRPFSKSDVMRIFKSAYHKIENGLDENTRAKFDEIIVHIGNMLKKDSEVILDMLENDGERM